MMKAYLRPECLTAKLPANLSMIVPANRIHEPTDGAVAYVAEQPDEVEIALERRYTVYG